MIFTVPIHETTLQEFNRCHAPGGHPDGGQFCDDGEVETLYRGDGRDVSTHALAKSDTSALFGAGIYLTNNKRIAGDYTVKGADVAFRYDGGKRGKKQDAINAYIRTIAQYTDVNGNETRFPESLPAMVDNPDRLKRLALAKAKWEAMEPSMEVRKSVDGLIVIRKKAERGPVSTYKIPKAWIKQTLDAEAEIPKDVAAAVADVVRTVNDGYKAQGADDIYRFATTPDEDGFLPSFRQVYRRASGMIGVQGYNFNEEAGQLALRRGLKALGYKGIRYAGGVTLGGGTKHMAYVFWDEQGLKKRRQK